MDITESVQISFEKEKESLLKRIDQELREFSTIVESVDKNFGSVLSVTNELSGIFESLTDTLKNE